MIIAGGVYVEDCVTPRTTQLLGSAGRAAFALSDMRTDLELHTYHPSAYWEDVRANFAPICTTCKLYPSSNRVQFSYLFPLGRPLQTPYFRANCEPQTVTGKQVLSFGCVEGDFVVQADVVVADLQGSTSGGFRAVGSQAEKLGIVLNAREVMSRTGKPTIIEAANELLALEGAEVVVVKDGPHGARVFERGQPSISVPAYSSKSLYKIGSGDIFSAIFAHYWMEGSAPKVAADLASRHTAAYVESPSLPLSVDLPQQTARQPKTVDQIYVVSSQNTIKDIWFIDLLSEAISQLGVADIQVTALGDLGVRLQEAVARQLAVSTLIVVNEVSDLDLIHLDLHRSNANTVIFLDNPSAEVGTVHGRVFADISQAIYELFWTGR